MILLAEVDKDGHEKKLQTHSPYEHRQTASTEYWKVKFRNMKGDYVSHCVEFTLNECKSVKTVHQVNRIKEHTGAHT
jgi:hypothetical protein